MPDPKNALRDESVRQERWPEKADYTFVADLPLYVYKTMAMVVPPPEDHDGCRDIWLDSDGLRELAAALTWAADRIDARKEQDDYVWMKADIDRLSDAIRWTLDTGIVDRERLEDALDPDKEQTT